MGPTFVKPTSVILVETRQLQGKIGTRPKVYLRYPYICIEVLDMGSMMKST